MKVYELKENKRPKIKPGVCIGKLTVIETTPERKNGYMVWRCDCECGGSICLDTRTLQPVSYTHLDVYKRQDSVGL